MRIDPIQLTSRRRGYRTGFSFTEILFAVMILGIGFIMVAAIFPVAIAQTKTSQEESVGASIVRNAVGSVNQIASLQYLPGTGAQRLSLLRPTTPLPLPVYTDIAELYADISIPTKVDLIDAAYPTPPLASISTQTVPGDVWVVGSGGFRPSIDAVHAVGSLTYTTDQLLGNIVWPMVSQNLIQTNDPRYGWVAFYKRDLIESGLPVGSGHTQITFAPTLQLIVVAVHSTVKPTYEAIDVVAGPPANTPITIQPSVGTIQFKLSDLTHFANRFSFIPPPSDASLRAVEGAFIIIASDNLATTDVFHGALNGHFYRLGTADSGGDWPLAPGFDLSQSDIAHIRPAETFSVYIIGKAQDPNLGNQYSGVAQDIAVYSTFIACGTN